ncbi:MAG: hypothetical protein ABSE63_07945 [Thermoguttaceae bacterium]
MFLFQTRKKTLGVQSFVLKLINNNCQELKALAEGPRFEKRVNLSLVVLVVPLENGELQVGKAFYAVTQELSVSGVGIILTQQLALDEVILGFRVQTEMTFVHATAKHLNEMGNGFYHLGLEMTEIAPISEYPALQTF